MFGIIAFVCFLVALILNIVDKSGTSSKYVLDFALAGGCFLGLALSPWGNWHRGW
jgi:hypothetical protein